MTARKLELDNPYWEVVQTFPQDDLFSRLNNRGRVKPRFVPDSYPEVHRLVTDKRAGLITDDQVSEGFEKAMKMSRSTLVHRFAWAIPSDDTVRWLAAQLVGRSVVEIGAGTGYWAHLLDQLDVPIIAFDAHLMDGTKNEFFDSDVHPFHPVHLGGPEQAALHPDKALMLCWPSYDEDLAIDCLNAYQGDMLVYIGEGWGGCCANEAFFTALDDGWEEVACFDEMIQWGGIHDYAWIYRRAAVTIDEEP